MCGWDWTWILKTTERKGNDVIKSIQSEFLAASVSSKGAELVSLKEMETGLEYIWSGETDKWSRSSPILFPVVGFVEDGTYLYKGREYSMELHGFVKDRAFVLAGQEKDRLIFRDESDAASLQQYPFAYRLDAGYSMGPRGITITRSLTNQSEIAMWFSIGEHPAFRTPLASGDRKEDYRLVFEKDEYIHRRFLEDGLITDRTETVFSGTRTLDITEALFLRRAIVLKGLESDWVALESTKTGKGVKVGIHGFPYLGIWSTPESPFVCIEPWYGVAGRKSGSKDIRDKEGIQRLGAGDTFEYSYTISIL